MAITLKLDPSRLTVGDLVALEDGNLKARYMRDFLARFVISGDVYLPIAEARNAIDEMNLTQLTEVTTQLGEQVKELQAAAVSPTNGDD